MSVKFWLNLKKEVWYFILKGGGAAALRAAGGAVVQRFHKRQRKSWNTCGVFSVCVLWSAGRSPSRKQFNGYRSPVIIDHKWRRWRRRKFRRRVKKPVPGAPRGRTRSWSLTWTQSLSRWPPKNSARSSTNAWKKVRRRRIPLRPGNVGDCCSRGGGAELCLKIHEFNGFFLLCSC